MSDNEVYKIKITADITITKEKQNTTESYDDWQWPEPKYEAKAYRLVDDFSAYDNTHPYILLVRRLKAGQITREEFDNLINRIEGQ